MLKSIKEGELKIGTLTMKVHILEDGSRVIEEQGVIDFMNWLGSEEIVKLPQEEIEEFCKKIQTF